VVEKIKAEYGEENIEVEWLPYLLRPEMPAEGEPLPAYVIEKSAQLGGRLKDMAAAGGLDFVQFQRSPNPRKAHEATEYAREQGKGELFHQRVFQKLYGEGRDISDWAVLREAAEEAGLDFADMQQRVDAGEYREAVNNLIAEAHAIGVQGVPFYIVNNKYGISGAQPIDVFRKAISLSQQEK
jgi:predicted DsbA family dithiol-disulfide isomerase